MQIRFIFFGGLSTPHVILLASKDHKNNFVTNKRSTETYLILITKSQELLCSDWQIINERV